MLLTSCNVQCVSLHSAVNKLHKIHWAFKTFQVRWNSNNGTIFENVTSYLTQLITPAYCQTKNLKCNFNLVTQSCEKNHCVNPALYPRDLLPLVNTGRLWEGDTPAFSHRLNTERFCRLKLFARQSQLPTGAKQVHLIGLPTRREAIKVCSKLP